MAIKRLTTLSTTKEGHRFGFGSYSEGRSRSITPQDSINSRDVSPSGGAAARLSSAEVAELTAEVQQLRSEKQRLEDEIAVLEERKRQATAKLLGCKKQKPQPLLSTSSSASQTPTLRHHWSWGSPLPGPGAGVNLLQPVRVLCATPRAATPRAPSPTPPPAGLSRGRSGPTIIGAPSVASSLSSHASRPGSPRVVMLGAALSSSSSGIWRKWREELLPDGRRREYYCVQPSFGTRVL